MNQKIKSPANGTTNKLKVVYLYMSVGSAVQNTVKWDKTNPCGNNYVEKMVEDGSFVMLVELKNRGIIDELLVFYESNRAPGFAHWGHGITGWVCPHIDFVREYIDEDTVIYVRGGFRGWWKLLDDYHGKNWLMCYNANTGRERWTFWDIVLWDLNTKQYLDRYGRLWYHYIKPIDEATFRPLDQKLIYDVCIGASHIHDKKGQWRCIDVLIEYKKRYGKNLKAVLPGWGVKGVETAQIDRKIYQYGLDVTRVGMLSRAELSNMVFNRSKCALFLGTHGQGDRGPIEALACGVPLMVGSQRHHSPYVLDERVSLVPPNLKDISDITNLLHWYLSNLPSRESVYKYYKDNMGFYEVCYPNLSKIFEFIRSNPKPSFKIKKELLDYALTGSGSSGVQRLN